MQVHILFGHRYERYEGQYGPEALNVIDEYCHDENPNYLSEKLSMETASGEFKALEIITVEVNAKEIMNRLYPNHNSPIPAKIVNSD